MAAYDSYDYPSYWETRKYEHLSEVIALRTLLGNVPKANLLIDLGAGYGRLTTTYKDAAKDILLVEPSKKLLSIAHQNLKLSNIKAMNSSIERINNKIKSSSADIVIMIRVIHHLKDLDTSFKIISRIAKKNSYFILEYPNKRNIKQVVLQFVKGNYTFPIDIFPKDLRSKKSIKKGSLPFVNYHPDYIKESLSAHGFKIIKALSVSNLRYFWFKKLLPLRFVLNIEAGLQKLLAPFSSGPSIFLLTKKVK